MGPPFKQIDHVDNRLAESVTASKCLVWPTLLLGFTDRGCTDGVVQVILVSVAEHRPMHTTASMLLLGATYLQDAWSDMYCAQETFNLPISIEYSRQCTMLSCLGLVPGCTCCGGPL